MKTLIVEDDFTSRLLMQTILADYGDCHTAVNGREAVEAFRIAVQNDEPYDLVCMDVMMPQMDGLSALNAIRRVEGTLSITHRQGAKIILTTALKDQDTVTTAYRELCDGYLVKPIDKGLLLRVIRELGLLPLTTA
jgi:two-component system, chemotaxis family, chemotaxis protein CheY